MSGEYAPRRRGAPRKVCVSVEERIVRAYWKGRAPVKTIAIRFGISRTAVYDMVRRNPQWKPDEVLAAEERRAGRSAVSR